MPVTIDAEGLAACRDQWHAACAACGTKAADSLGLVFALSADGSVEAVFQNGPRHQGYDGMQHGGVTATLLDSAMTNCLFARRVAAVTGQLTVRYRRPVTIGEPCIVRARLERSLGPCHYLTGQLLQRGQVAAVAKGTFMELKK